jgi:hypothetical protein
VIGVTGSGSFSAFSRRYFLIDFIAHRNNHDFKPTNVIPTSHLSQYKMADEFKSKKQKMLK